MILNGDTADNADKLHARLRLWQVQKFLLLHMELDLSTEQKLRKSLGKPKTPQNTLIMKEVFTVTHKMSFSKQRTYGK
jgi:hypothetical protein